MQIISEAELSRLEKISFHEKRLRGEGFTRIAGVDEAGRGPLAGPVVAAACILPEGTLFPDFNDSKLLSGKTRNQLFEKIISSRAIYGLGVIDVETIDRINILQATFLAMQQAVTALPLRPDYILIDGNQLPHFSVPAECLVQGDSLSISIAAASILAKVTRDRMMEKIDQEYPEYGFKQHKGYGTRQHLKAIDTFGPSPVHRRSFHPMKSIQN